MKTQKAGQRFETAIAPPLLLVTVMPRVLVFVSKNRRNVGLGFVQGFCVLAM